MKLPTVVIQGATASGKTSLSVDLCHTLKDHGYPAEIVNADSMLVYRGMDIGTAKPTMADRRGIPHHLIDIMNISDTASVVAFRDHAREAITDCHHRDVIPVVVGGSALYLHAIVDILDFPPRNTDVRDRLQRDMESDGVCAMYAKLEALAPQAAATIGPADSRRIIRALEALELQGEFRSQLPAWRYELDGVIQIGLEISRPAMDSRIEARVGKMWELGFVNEVRGLLGRGLKDSPTASRAIGYLEILKYLDGELSEDEAKERTVIKTRQFSRKQLSWWRRDTRITWVDASVTASMLYADLVPHLKV